MNSIFTKKRKWLIVPVEVKVREFESRLLVSLYAISKGFGVVFGDQKKILHYLDQLPRGIYFDKSISKNKYEILKQIVDKGFVLTSIDEEGLPRHMKSFMYLKQRVSQETLDLASKVFTWGADEKKVITDAYPSAKKKVIVTGNPRTDIWHGDFKKIYDEKAKEYKKKYGKYILMPSNFGVNHINGVNFLIKQARDYKIIENDADEKIYRDFLKIDQEILEKFTDLSVKVAKQFDDYTIIIRPHPAEDQEYWKKKIGERKNIKVIYEGSITPWILGAELLIHSSCTTGLEGFLMGKSVISFLPLGKNEMRSHISDFISHTAQDADGVLSIVQSVVSDSPKEENQSAKYILKESLNFTEGEFAFKNIVNEFEKLNIRENKFDILKRLLLKIKKTLRRTRENTAYARQKFPGISIEGIKEVTKGFSDCSGELVSPKIIKLDNDLYVLYK